MKRASTGFDTTTLSSIDHALELELDAPESREKEPLLLLSKRAGWGFEWREIL